MSDEEKSSPPRVPMPPGQWVIVQADGYQLDISQYSNKGPMMIVRDQQGEEIGRAWLDLLTGKWQTRMP